MQELDPLADFADAQRQQRRKRAGILVVALALLGAGWTWWRAGRLPPLDPERVRAAERSLDGLSTALPETHALRAAAVMVELEGERLPAAMVEAFAALEQQPPAQRAGEIMLAPFAEDPDTQQAWSVACPAGVEAIEAYTASRDIDALFADCSLGRWSLIDGTAARRRSAGRLVLAHAAWAWLVDHHSDTELERRALRVFVQG